MLGKNLLEISFSGEKNMDKAKVEKFWKKYNKIGEIANKFWSPKFLRPKKNDSRLKKTAKAWGMLAWKGTVVVTSLSTAPIPTLLVACGAYAYQTAPQQAAQEALRLAARDALKNSFVKQSSPAKSKVTQRISQNTLDQIRGIRSSEPPRRRQPSVEFNNVYTHIVNKERRL